MSSQNNLPSISTKAEMLDRLRNRPKPALSLEHRPLGGVTQEVHRKVSEENELRIAKLRSSLGDAKQRTETDHTFARLKGFPSAQFDRSR